MTRYTIKCPYCGSVLEKGTGSKSTKIGIRFRVCPNCKKVYTDKYLKEWVNFSPAGRVMYFIDAPAVAGIFAMLVLALVLTMFEVLPTAACWGIGVGGGVVVGVAFFFFGRKKIKADIAKSLERTKSKSYVEELIRADLKIYEIKGVEVGTVDDAEEQSTTNTDTVVEPNEPTAAADDKAVQSDELADNSELKTETETPQTADTTEQDNK